MNIFVLFVILIIIIIIYFLIKNKKDNYTQKEIDGMDIRVNDRYSNSSGPFQIVELAMHNMNKMI